MTKGEKVVLSIIFIILIVPLLFLLFYVPPNNSDAVTCYLIRVENWLWNGNIEAYPTQNLYEIYYNHFPQFFMVNMRALSGGDSFSAVFQFFAYIGSAIAASAIVKEVFNGNRKAQWLSALIVICLPQAILQSTATMYDLQAGYFCLIAAYFGFRLLKRKSFQIPDIIFFALSFAFASYTKYTSIFFIFPFSLWVIFAIWRNSLQKMMLTGVMLVFVFVIIHLPLFMSNHQMFGKWIAPGKEYARLDQVVNEKHSFSDVISGLSKNIALNFNTYSSSINGLVHSSVLKLHSALNVDVNDRQLNLNHYYEKGSGAISETVTGNTFIAFLGIITLVLFVVKLLARRGFKDENKEMFYLLCLSTGFILFCIVFKFQQWNARLQLPFFLLLAPWLAMQIIKFLEKRERIVSILIVCLILSALPCVYLNYGKPLVSYYSLRSYFNRPPQFVNKREIATLLEMNGGLTEEYLRPYYSGESNSSFLKLDPNLASDGRSIAISLLNSIGYFQTEKSIFEKSENEMRLHPGNEGAMTLMHNYEKAANFLSKKGDSWLAPIGLVFRHSEEYPFLSMMDGLNIRPSVKLRHISTIELIGQNRNFYRPFEYRYIVTNDSRFISMLDRSAILQDTAFGGIHVISLNKLQQSRYVLSKDGKTYLLNSELSIRE
ncbi:MAG: glycosyltransferase family 39 protein [Bacteroidetes bacterium]|nr:glycosyltransferase family 39 protein [Bacteroidota bacterium]